VVFPLLIPVEIGPHTDQRLYAYSDQHPPGGKSDWFTITGTTPEQPQRAVSFWIGTNFFEYDADELDGTWCCRYGVPYPADGNNGPAVPVGGAIFIQNYRSRYSLPSPIPPSLSIVLTPANTVVVQWPYVSPGFILQQHTNLSTTNWIASTNVIHDNGTYQFITVDPPVESRYYRLFKQ